MISPKVTVLMPVYNGEKHLNDAVNSILNQTFKNFEFIIINDASTDGTYEILKSFSDPRIRIYTNKNNMGIAKSLNFGIKMSKGEYLARQDSDDTSTPKRLNKQVYFLDTHPDYAIVGSFARVLNEYSEELRVRKRPTEDADIRQYLKTDNCIIHGSVMIRMSSLLNVGLYDESMDKSQDYELWLRLSKKYKLTNIPEFLYLRKINQEKLGIKYIKEQQIFVTLAKIKNESVEPEEATKYFINSISKHCFIPSGFNLICKFIGLITFKRININYIFRVLYRIRYTKDVKSILHDFKMRKTHFDEAALNLRKILDTGLLRFLLQEKKSSRKKR